MKNKLSKLLWVAIVAIFWLLIYELLAFAISYNSFFPHLNFVFAALVDIVASEKFLIVCTLTLLRVVIALTLGTLLGIALGILSAKFNFVYRILNPFMTVVKATPVASFIIILWMLLNGDALAITIALFMVMPIIWQSTYSSFDTIDKGLLEVADVFMLDSKYKLTVLYLPNLKKYLIPSLITSVGLAWKSEIATEIIAYTSNSIGQLINDGKYNNENIPSVFAWTFIVIVFSVIFEALTKSLLRRIKI